MQLERYDIAFDSGTLLQEAKKGMDDILGMFPEFKEKEQIQHILCEIPWTRVEQLDEVVQCCETVLTTLEASAEKLKLQKHKVDALQDGKLDQIMASVEPQDIVKALCEHLERDVTFSLNLFSENFEKVKPGITEDLYGEIREKLGMYIQDEDVQKALDQLKKRLQILLDNWVEKVREEVTKRLNHFQTESQGVLTSAENQLRENHPYFQIIKFAQEYLETVEPPDFYIKRVDRFCQELHQWKNWVENRVTLLAGDSYYRECLETGNLKISTEDKETLLRLFGKYKTDFKARLAGQSNVTEWEKFYYHCRDQIHVTSDISRRIFEHACEWLELILPHWKETENIENIDEHR